MNWSIQGGLKQRCEEGEGMVLIGPNYPLRLPLILVALLGWLLYTKFWAELSTHHLALPTCPFLQLTGHPCPLCGGTRSFALLWRGDLTHAFQLYPLGPLLFGLTIAAVGVLLGGVIFQRQIWISHSILRGALLVGGLLLGCSWILKLTILPN
ncbi:MAG: DUF2752 domain-containing protein [Candidatus Dormibacteraceae bacterium]